MTRHKLILTLITAGLVVAATSAAFSMYAPRWFTKDSPMPSQTEVTLVAAPTLPLAQTPPIPVGTTPNFRAIVQQMGPTVVGVNVLGSNRVRTDDFALDLNDPFFRFFRGLPGFQWCLPGQGPGSVVPSRSQGSGFIISSDGLILTNALVVRETKKVTVKLSDRREFKARMLGADTVTELVEGVSGAAARANLPPGDVLLVLNGVPLKSESQPFGVMKQKPKVVAFLVLRGGERIFVPVEFS